MGWETSTRRSRLPRGWAKLRQQVLARDGHRCTATDDRGRCPQPATDVDHVQAGDDHDLSNLTSLCGAHHRSKTNREAVQARWAKTRRPPQRHPGLL